jgi:hypothetical protein
MMYASRYLIVFFTVLVCASAQPGSDEHFGVSDDAVCTFGTGMGFLGFTTLLVANDYSSVSSILADLKLPEFGNWFILYGAEAHSGVGGLMIPNADVTFHCSAGVRSVDGRTVIDGVVYARSMRHTHVQYGLQPGYVICLKHGWFLIPGIMLGEGFDHLSVTQTAINPNAGFGQLVGSGVLEGRDTSTIARLSRNTVLHRCDFFLTPEVALQYTINNLLAARLRVGYRCSVTASSWDDNNDIEFSSAPDLRLKGIVVQVTLQYGEFFDAPEL